MSCPRCFNLGLVPIPGGIQCVLCGYEEVKASLSIYHELMANMPGAPMPNRVERYDEKVNQGKKDAALARGAAKRYGVSLEDLRVRMHYKTTPLKTRAALQSAIFDLTVAGLDVQRVADALGKSPRTIGKSPGLARGWAARKQAILHQEVVEVMSEYKGSTPNTMAAIRRAARRRG